MQIASLYRYPVKGLTPEKLDLACLTPGRCIPWDRAFALAQGDAKLDPAKPEWLPKWNFMCLLRNAGIALLDCRFEEAAGLLHLSGRGVKISASPFTEAGRAELAAFLTEYLGAEARIGEDGTRPRFVYAQGHSFCDLSGQVISLIGLNSIAALEAAAGGRRDPRRFRANIYISDLPEWEEFGWIGHELAIGDAVLKVQDRIPRCGATTVNPDTAERDANPVRELQQNFGHFDLGVFAEVVQAGEIRPGDTIRLK
jgi:uncharacterized protein YcbX